jgi:hypothetical protein
MRAIDSSIFPAVTPPIVKKTAGPVAAGAAAGAAAHQSGLGWPTIIGVALVGALIAFLIFHFTRKD